MIRLLSIILLTASVSTSLAQVPRSGKVYLRNSDVIAGTIDINSFSNAATVTTEDGRQLTYHASMLAAIETTDECDFRRKYYCYDYRSNRFFDRMEKKIFQVVAEGEVTLLRRLFEYDVFDTTDEYTIEEWYYLNDKGEVRRIRNFKRQLYAKMDRYEQAMEEFRQRNEISNLNREENMFLMVSFYNRLHNLSDDTLTFNDKAD